MSMEQYLLQVPKRIAAEVRAAIGSSESGDVEMISLADNKHFRFVVNGKEYASKIAQLPCILETHKTYDDNVLYKSGEIGQIFVVTDKEDEKQFLEQVTELPHGITPPNTNVIKRKFEKTKRYTPFPKPEVSRIEEDLVKMIQGGPYEETHEELVDFYDWMVDDEHPNGIVVTDEIALIEKHPEYLELTSDSSSKPLQRGGSSGDYANSSMDVSAFNTPVVTDIGSESESRTAGMESAQRSPAFAPTPSPVLSQEEAEEKEVDDLEDDFLSGMDERKPEPSDAQKQSYRDDPAYLNLLSTQERLEQSLRAAERDASEFAAKMNDTSNITVKTRFKQSMEAAQAQRDEVAAKLEQVRRQIREMETS